VSGEIILTGGPSAAGLIIAKNKILSGILGGAGQTDDDN
jgi:hypothetical protein